MPVAQQTVEKKKFLKLKHQQISESLSIILGQILNWCVSMLPFQHKGQMGMFFILM